MTPQVRIEIPWKQWVMTEAERLGIDHHALQMRLARKRHPLPPHLKRGPTGRIISLTIFTAKAPNLP